MQSYLQALAGFENTRTEGTPEDPTLVLERIQKLGLKEKKSQPK